MFCKQCGKPIDDGQELCEECKAAQAQTFQGNQQYENPMNDAGQQQYQQPQQPQQQYQQQQYNNAPQAKSKMAAGLLGIFLGTWGVHNFYLGYTTKAIIQVVLGVCGFITCGLTSLGSAIWGLVEGIMILTGSINKDGKGMPLKD